MNRSFSIIIVGCAFSACAELPDVSKVCQQMCTTATALYGDCLESWGVGWSDGGFDNAADHQETCEVWSWEIAELHGRGVSDQLCEDRAEVLRNGECNDYTDIDWNETP